MHDHDSGKCKPDCYGCFVVDEGLKSLTELEDKLEEAEKVIESGKAFLRDMGGSDGHDAGVAFGSSIGTYCKKYMG